MYEANLPGRKRRIAYFNMSEFGSIKNAGAAEPADEANNGSLAQFGVVSPAETGLASFEAKAATKNDSNAMNSKN